LRPIRKNSGKGGKSKGKKEGKSLSSLRETKVFESGSGTEPVVLLKGKKNDLSLREMNSAEALSAVWVLTRKKKKTRAPE